MDTNEGKGKFLIARWTGLATRIVGATEELQKDLVLEPYQSKVISPKWLEVSHFVKDVDAGNIELTYSDTVPDAVSMDVNEQYMGVLDEQQKANIRVMVLAPVIDDAMKSVIQLDSNIDANGFAKKGSQVTVIYLKEHHLPFLDALSEVEGRFQKRKSLMNMCKKAADRIRKM